MLDKQQENLLIADIKRGDRRAMEVLVKEFERPVYNAAYRMLGNPDDAADVTQTTFMNVFRKLGQFNSSYRLFSWIYRIAMNESIDQLKRRPQTEQLSPALAAGGPGPAARLQATQVSQRVQSALMELSEDYRSVIVLRYFTGCNYEQMAVTLSIPEKTVKSRLYTARQLLKTSLVDNKESNL
ncbi:MAG: sigma-70 family RNA polymerase sigma factor [Gammaproteobacteria bacterium]|nr:sigma-70 family RNA polymerase sigma factor [Gammaproteobacteria bacterium]